jgi:hypothetical protein
VGKKIQPTESHGEAQRATEVIQWFSIALTAAFVPYHKLPVMRTLQLLAFVSLFFNLTANSQIPKGSLFFGGDVAFSFEKGSSNTGEYDVNQFYFAPVFGLALKQNFLAGIYLMYHTVESDVPLDFNDLDQQSYGAGIFARQYFPLGKSRFSVFLQEQASVIKDKIKQAYSTTDRIDQDLFIINVAAYPGLSFNLSRKLQLESGFSNLFGIRYVHRETTSGTIVPEYSESDRLDLYFRAENISQLYVGFRLFILQ